MHSSSRLASYRRKSSLINGLTPVKPGNYGISPSPRPSPRGVVFAPNVTPGTFIEPEPPIDEDTPMPPSPSDALFPPSLNPEQPQSRRRAPPGKRRSQGYIPRPPNAFMLFRADFVRQKHVPGSIETNHGSLSKIIGNCWRSLGLEEKKVWENLAKQAKVKHQKMYPNYRFRPVHNKDKKAAREAAKAKAAALSSQDEQRCEDVANMLLDGKKGDALVAAVRDYDQSRTASSSPAAGMLHAPMPTFAFESHHPPSALSHFDFTRRSSSVPLPGIAMPSLPFLLPHQSQFQTAGMEHPISQYARSRMAVGSRRPSSAAPILGGSWEMPNYFSGPLQQDDEPLPEVNTGLFADSFTWGAMPNHMNDATAHGNMMMLNYQQPPSLALCISPLDNVAPSDNLASASTAQPSAFPYLTPDNPDAQFTNMHWLPRDPPAASSGPSSAFSGSPAHSETSLPVQQQQPNLHAPKPQHPVPLDGWDHHQGAGTVGFDQLSMHDEFGMGSSSAGVHSEYDPTTYVMGHPADLYPCGMESNDAFAYHEDLMLEVPRY